MKIIAIGDPHGDLEKVKTIPVKGADIILLTGDLGSASLMRKMAFENIERQKKGLPKKEATPRQKKAAFMEAYTSTMKIIKYLQKFAPVYTIYGNVESSNAETKKLERKLKMKLPYLTNELNALKNVHVINNKLLKFGKIKIGGLEYFVDTNWVQEFKPNDFRKRMKHAKKGTNKAKKVLKKFNNLDILVCHQPPYKILDLVGGHAPAHWHGKHAGSTTIKKYIEKKKPKYVFCGHIHEGEGNAKIGKTDVYNLGVGGYKIIEL